MNIYSYENITKAIMFSDKKTLIKELKENEIDMFLDVTLLIEEGQWKVDKDYSLDMKLYLYNYYDKNNVQNIFAYEPYEKQWWITGFNPNFYNPDVNDMMMVGVIDLKDDKEDVYEAIKEKYEYEKKNNIYYKKENIIFFEDEYNKIWLIWMGK